GDGRHHQDVALVLAAAPGPAQVVAAHTRGLVVKRPEPVATGRAGLARLPALLKQLLALEEAPRDRGRGAMAAAGPDRDRTKHRQGTTRPQPAFANEPQPLSADRIAFHVVSLRCDERARAAPRSRYSPCPRRAPGSSPDRDGTTIDESVRMRWSVVRAV